MLKPEKKAQPAKILTYHIISGNFDAAAVAAAIKNGKGKLEITTVSVGKLTASMDMGKVKLTDRTRKSAFVTITYFKGSNEVIHVIDAVVLPK